MNKIKPVWFYSLYRNYFSSKIQFSFRLTSLIYAEKFEFENPAIMEDKQCKQMERFLAMANKSDYFLSLADKSKQIYKVKINNIQRYDPYQIKKGRTFR